LAYLFARATDSIADTDLIDRNQRLEWLNRFRAQFIGDEPEWTVIRSIRTALVSHQPSSGERMLLGRLEDCFRIYSGLESGDRQRIRTLMGTLTKGMEMDLTVFPGDSMKDLAALETMDDLDRYTYYVAGCVGEFWTATTCAHLSSLRRWNAEHMAKVGVRFGKGLQLTNVLKDVARDLQRGRCYIPLALLRQAGLAPRDLLRRENGSAFRPVLIKLARLAMDHLDQGWLYTMAIPRHEIRLRLACMWPILLAGETLKRLVGAADLLNPAVIIKVPKSQVYRIMALTMLTGGCAYVGTAYWGRLRKAVI
jgi:farnesyl-diphosphate farnesyltransferase